MFFKMIVAKKFFKFKKKCYEDFMKNENSCDIFSYSSVLGQKLECKSRVCFKMNYFSFPTGLCPSNKLSRVLYVRLPTLNI